MTEEKHANKPMLQSEIRAIRENPEAALSGMRKQEDEIDRLVEAEAILLDMIKSMNGEWQPIETAPKGGPSFLVFCSTIDEDSNAYEICSPWGLRNGIFAGDLIPIKWTHLPPPPTV